MPCGEFLHIFYGEYVAVMGPSDQESQPYESAGLPGYPTGGSYYLDGQEVSQLEADQLALVRNQNRLCLPEL